MVAVFFDVAKAFDRVGGMEPTCVGIQGHSMPRRFSKESSIVHVTRRAAFSEAIASIAIAAGGARWSAGRWPIRWAGRPNLRHVRFAFIRQVPFVLKVFDRGSARVDTEYTDCFIFAVDHDAVCDLAFDSDPCPDCALNRLQ
ncbi:hypothetical protein EVAR_70915_1 [Eumeta japonica]|uniref:Uncharacterized protein n=1 Tax=Eumeta variegata TaxID=151549 RepID=A0A4C2AEK0_EUMVA|nr:hypothetical protein EVAR_70915_1 [Eumeta japonica]